MRVAAHLPARCVFRFDNERRQAAMCGGERSRQSAGARADDDDVPPIEAVEVDAFVELCDFEVRHAVAPAMRG